MSIFKKKIDFSQFLADLISVQFEFLEKNFDKLIILADEFGVCSISIRIQKNSKTISRSKNR